MSDLRLNEIRTEPVMSAFDGVHLRLATDADATKVWEWNNAPEVREVSLSQSEIDWETHERWYSFALSDPSWRIWIILSGGRESGVVRIREERGNPNSATVSIALDRSVRGRGVGPRALVAAATAYMSVHPKKRLLATIAADNGPSRYCFEKAGFRYVRDREEGDRLFSEFELTQLSSGPVEPRPEETPMQTTSKSPAGDATEQLGLWTSQFGADYTDRNNHEIPERNESWAKMMEGVDADRILEVGCNVGWNLTYLSRLRQLDLWGIEPQTFAVRRARERSQDFNIVQGNAFDLPFKDNSFDLVFTSGVMIHIAPADLPRAMREIYRTSRRYILYVEYDHPVEERVVYRGESDALWRRPHGEIWQREYPDLKLVRSGFWDKSAGYDNCTYGLFVKGV